MCSKACVTTRDFSIESTAFTLMLGDILTIETICNVYIEIKTFNQLVSKFKKTLAVASYNL